MDPPSPQQQNDPSPTEYITRLKQRITQCEEEGRYKEAKQTREKVEMLEDEVVRTKLAELKIQHRDESRYLQMAYESEFQLFTDGWKRRLFEYGEASKELIADMKKRHAEENDSFLQETMSDDGKKVHYSSELLVLKKQEREYLRQKDYTRAEAARAKAALLEAEEEKRFADGKRKQVNKQMERIRQRQSTELDVLKHKIESGRTQIENARDNDVANLMRRMSNAKRELEALQKIEIQNSIMSKSSVGTLHPSASDGIIQNTDVERIVDKYIRIFKESRDETGYDTSGATGEGDDMRSGVDRDTHSVGGDVGGEAREQRMTSSSRLNAGSTNKNMGTRSGAAMLGKSSTKGLEATRSIPLSRQQKSKTTKSIYSQSSMPLTIRKSRQGRISGTSTSSSGDRKDRRDWAIRGKSRTEAYGNVRLEPMTNDGEEAREEDDNNQDQQLQMGQRGHNHGTNNCDGKEQPSASDRGYIRESNEGVDKRSDSGGEDLFKKRDSKFETTTVITTVMRQAPNKIENDPLPGARKAGKGVALHSDRGGKNSSQANKKQGNAKGSYSLNSLPDGLDDLDDSHGEREDSIGYTNLGDDGGTSDADTNNNHSAKGGVEEEEDEEEDIADDGEDNSRNFLEPMKGTHSPPKPNGMTKHQNGYESEPGNEADELADDEYHTAVTAVTASTGWVGDHKHHVIGMDNEHGNKSTTGQDYEFADVRKTESCTIATEFTMSHDFECTGEAQQCPEDNKRTNQKLHGTVRPKQMDNGEDGEEDNVDGEDSPYNPKYIVHEISESEDVEEDNGTKDVYGEEGYDAYEKHDNSSGESNPHGSGGDEHMAEDDGYVGHLDGGSGEDGDDDNADDIPRGTTKIVANTNKYQEYGGNANSGSWGSF